MILSNFYKAFEQKNNEFCGTWFCGNGQMAETVKCDKTAVVYHKLCCCRSGKMLLEVDIFGIKKG